MRLQKRYLEQLDVRRIISNSIAFQDFIRCFLSKPQQALLAHQKTRIGSLQSDGTQDLTSDVDYPLGNLPSVNFADDLKGFDPQDKFD